MTGEKLPVHADLDAADRYAQWRSDNQYNEDIFNESYWHRDAAMPYYADPSASYNEDTPTLEAYRPTLRDNAHNNIREGLMDFGLSEGVFHGMLATGVTGERKSYRWWFRHWPYGFYHTRSFNGWARSPS